MVRRVFVFGAALAVVLGGVLGTQTVASAANPTSLTLDGATAFAILGHSCGGIQHQDFGSGFDVTGNPAGYVYIQTRCGGSGRGGGYHVTTYSAWVAVNWDFTGAVTTYAVTAVPAFASPATFNDARGDTITNQLSAVNVLPPDCSPGNVTYCTYRAYLTINAPGQPTGVTATESNDALMVSWTPAADGGPITSSRVTATPTAGPAPVLSAVVISALASSATLPGVVPNTTYSITVTGTNAAGDGPASAPATFTSGPPTTLPGVPTSLTVAWRSGGTVLHVSWAAAVAGDSPTDDYQLQIARHDPNGTPTVLDAGGVTTFDSTAYRSDWDWSVRVRAHNAAGWSAWSKAKVRFAY